MNHIDLNTQVRCHPVYPHESSFIRGINYIPENQMMEVRMKDDEHGEVPYFYPDTTEAEFEAFISADSYGRYYTQNIKIGNQNLRNTDARGTTELREKMESALNEAVGDIVNLVQDNDPALFDMKRELFESVSRRKYDRSVLYVEDNANILKLTFDFRRLIISEAIDAIHERHPDEPEWVVECMESAEKCADVSTSYMTLEKI